MFVIENMENAEKLLHMKMGIVIHGWWTIELYSLLNAI